MPNHPKMPTRGMVAAALSAMLLGACSDDSTASPPPPTTTTTTAAQPAAVEVDWAARTVTGVADADVMVDFCEFDVAGLQSAMPLIAELAAGSALPAPDDQIAEGGSR